MAIFECQTFIKENVIIFIVIKLVYYENENESL